MGHIAEYGFEMENALDLQLLQLLVTSNGFGFPFFALDLLVFESLDESCINSGNSLLDLVARFLCLGTSETQGVKVCTERKLVNNRGAGTSMWHGGLTLAASLAEYLPLALAFTSST